MKQVEIWLKGMLAAAISGAAGGVLTGLAAVGSHSGGADALIVSTTRASYKLYYVN